MNNLENSKDYSDWTHPIDYFEPEQPEEYEVQRPLVEFINRYLHWLCDSQTLRDRGLRCTASAWALSPEIFENATLEELAVACDCDPQSLHRLAQDFRKTLGIRHE